MGFLAGGAGWGLSPVCTCPGLLLVRVPCLPMTPLLAWSSACQVPLSAQVPCPTGDSLLPCCQSFGAPPTPGVRGPHLKDLRALGRDGLHLPLLAGQAGWLYVPPLFRFWNLELGYTARRAPRPSLTILRRERGALSLAAQCLKPSTICSFPGMRSLCCKLQFATSDSLGIVSVCTGL